jgi:hypothetical protein
VVLAVGRLLGQARCSVPLFEKLPVICVKIQHSLSPKALSETISTVGIMSLVDQDQRRNNPWLLFFMDDLTIISSKSGDLLTSFPGILS